jgi:hypothetical protein
VGLFEFIGWMLGVCFAVLGGLFGLGVDVYGFLVSEYRFMGESGSVRLIWGLFNSDSDSGGSRLSCKGFSFFQCRVSSR